MIHVSKKKIKKKNSTVYSFKKQKYLDNKLSVQFIDSKSCERIDW